MVSKNLFLPGFNWKSSKAFGGKGAAKGNPREARPISVKRPMHLVLKSEQMGPKRSFFEHGTMIEEICNKTAAKTLVKVRGIAAAHDHLHLIIQPKSIYAYRRFIRALTGKIARKILNAEKGRAWKKGEKSFWQARPFTRIVEWGKDYYGLHGYLMKNKLDHLGFSREASGEMLQKISDLKKQGLVATGFA